MFIKRVWQIFFALTLLSLLTPLWVFKELLFPFITSKAFFFRVVIEAALPFYLYLIFKDKKLRPNIKNALNLAVLVFLFINIVTSFTGVNIARSLWGNFERMGGTWYLLHLTALYFYVQAVGQKDVLYLKRFLQFFVSVGVFLSLSALSTKLGGPSIILDTWAPTRVSSTFGNPIFFASYLIIPIFLALYLAVLEKNRELKITYCIGAFLMFLGVYFSGTRGAIVGLLLAAFICITLYSVFTKKISHRKFGFGFLCLLLLLVGSLYLGSAKLSKDSTLRRIVSLKDSNTEARLIQWQMALKGSKEHLLLGVGPENYYVIFDKFYNPELYKYDPSWFDKPHNFLLEVLDTNGIFGLIAYLATFLFAGLFLWQAFRVKSLGLTEACLLAGSLIAYQVQNLFVFDTVSASMAWYGFLGFVAVIGFNANNIIQKEKHLGTKEVLWHKYLLVFVCLLVIVLEYISNIESIQVSKRVNFGQVYSDVDVRKASEYFIAAFLPKYNLDQRETANFYSRFASNLLSETQNTIDKNFVSEQLDNAISKQRLIAQKVKNDPILWSNLAVAEMNRALLQGQGLEEVKPDIDRTINLAPLRVELLQLNMQYEGYIKNWPAVAQQAEQISELNPYSPNLHWQLAMAYYLNNNLELAVKAGDRAIADGFKFTQLQQFAWYIQYYEAQKDWHKVVPLLEQAVALEPNEIGLYIDLAQAYANIGDTEHAKILAQQVILSDPGQKAAMEKFISTLK